MKIQIDTGADKEINLDEIMDLIFRRASEDEDSPYHEFIAVNDTKMYDAIKEYTQTVREYDFTGLKDEWLDDAVGDLSESLSDTIFTVNLAYLELGIKFGVRLLLGMAA